MIKLDETLIHSVVRGNGPPVILTHGLAASLNDWDTLIPALVEAGYRVCASDLIGHGDSIKPSDLELYHTRTVYAVLDYWIKELELSSAPVLVGHSMGGYLSIRYALGHMKEIRGLVLIAPLYTVRQLYPLEHLLRLRPGLGKKVLKATPEALLHTFAGIEPEKSRRFSPEARRSMVADLKRASPNILHLLRSVEDLTPKVPYLNVKTLVIWGDADLSLVPSFFPTLVAALPNAAGHVIHGCGHQPHLAYPEQVNQLILDFISGL